LLADARADARTIVVVIIVVVEIIIVIIVVGDGRLRAELVEPRMAGGKGMAGERQRHPDGQEQARLQQ
jgi:hypothetical protein